MFLFIIKIINNKANKEGIENNPVLIDVAVVKRVDCCRFSLIIKLGGFAVAKKVQPKIVRGDENSDSQKIHKKSENILGKTFNVVWKCN